MNSSRQGKVAAALHFIHTFANTQAPSLDHSVSHLQGLTLALKQAPLTLSYTTKAKSGSHSVYWSCAGSKGSLCLVHRPWACIRRGAPVALETHPKLPGGGITQAVGHPTSLSLPVAWLAISGVYSDHGDALILEVFSTVASDQIAADAAKHMQPSKTAAVIQNMQTGQMHVLYAVEMSSWLNGLEFHSVEYQ